MTKRGHGLPKPSTAGRIGTATVRPWPAPGVPAGSAPPATRKKSPGIRSQTTGPRTSALEERFGLQCSVAGLPMPVREHRFHPTRRFRFDFAWPQHRLAIEIEGGVWTGGRHTRGTGFSTDCAKYNAAAMLGWIVLRFTGEMVNNGTAIESVRQALEAAWQNDK